MNARTRNVIEHLFPPEQQQEACDLLDIECGRNLPFLENSDEQGLERIRFAVLKLSKGNLDELYRVVQYAQTDWRDTLMGADFGTSVTAHNEWVKQFAPAE